MKNRRSVALAAHSMKRVRRLRMALVGRRSGQAANDTGQITSEDERAAAFGCARSVGSGSHAEVAEWTP